MQTINKQMTFPGLLRQRIESRTRNTKAGKGKKRPCKQNEACKQACAAANRAANTAKHRVHDVFVSEIIYSDVKRIYETSNYDDKISNEVFNVRETFKKTTITMWHAWAEKRKHHVPMHNLINPIYFESDHNSTNICLPRDRPIKYFTRQVIAEA
jgi:hypothetical protein